MSQTHPRPVKPRKHLMTPGQPRPQSTRSTSLTTVQRWVMSTLAVSTGLHLAAGLVLAAHYVDVRSSAIGLLVIAGVLGVLTMAGGILIHRSPLLVRGRLPHPLLLVGLLPPALGAWWIFG
jgi:hypothetical protein